MATLATALEETSRLVSEDAVPVALERSIGTGVNAMLCDSIQAMSQFAGLKALDLSFQWAPASNEGLPDVSRVVFEKEKINNVKVLSDRLKQRAEIRRMSILGRVSKLERPEGVDDPDEAIVTIRGELERDHERVFRVALSGASHILAIRAYRQRRMVLITGDVDLSKAALRITGDVTIEEANP
jgi:hypothetical protein